MRPRSSKKSKPKITRKFHRRRRVVRLLPLLPAEPRLEPGPARWLPQPELRHRPPELQRHQEQPLLHPHLKKVRLEVVAVSHLSHLSQRNQARLLRLLSLQPQVRHRLDLLPASTADRANAWAQRHRQSRRVLELLPEHRARTAKPKASNVE